MKSFLETIALAICFLEKYKLLKKKKAVSNSVPEGWGTKILEKGFTYHVHKME